jgi:ABC-type molybdate transport system ATPase subunit
MAQEVLRGLGEDPRALLGRLPEEMGSLERKLVAFVRLLTAEPELAVLDSVDEGLSAGEESLSERFEAEYRSRQPGGSLLHVDAEREFP